MSLIPTLTDAGRGLLIAALSGSPLTFSRIKIGNGAAPDEPHAGDRWYDTDNLVLRQYLEGWVESPRSITCGTTEPETPSYNDLWYNTATGTLYYYGDGWSPSFESIACSTAEPEQASQGDYWYDTANSVLYTYAYKWTAENGVNIIASQNAPESPSAGDYWVDGANGQLNIYALLWAVKQGLTASAGDIAPATPAEGDYWYDTANSALKVAAYSWKQKADVNFTISDMEPESPEAGDYWYNAESSTLKKYADAAWADDDAQPIHIGGDAPVSPSAGDWWHDGATLYEYALVWEADSSHTITYGDTAPADAAEGNWWYNTTGDVLMEYALGWRIDTDHTFSYSDTPPDSPKAGDWWFDNSLHVYAQGWIAVSESVKKFHYGSAAPALPAYGNWWYDSANGVLYEYGMLWQANTGDVFSYSESAPPRAYDGELWYNTSNAMLMYYSTGWADDEQKFTYSSLPPITPEAGDWWYNSSENVLYEYSGVQWNQNSTPISCGASAPATQDALTDLVNPMVSIPITGMARGSNYVSITGDFDNNDISNTFKWTETGIFATDEEGNEFLYAYCYSGEDYETIPSNDCGRTVGINLTLLVMIGDAQDVTAVIGEGALYATKEALEDHKRDYKNPHGVTAEQVGLGNVENVAPADMVIKFGATETLSEPTAEDKLSIILGKVKRAIATLIAHLKAENPHSITVAKIKAAAEKHTHSAGDINSGILQAKYGGTGVASEAELVAKLSSKPVSGYFTGDGSVKRKIELNFTPSAVFMCNGRGMVGDDIDGACGGLCVGGYGLRTRSCTAISHETVWSDTHTAMMITTNGFYVNYNASNKVATNKSGETYRYIAFR